MICRKCNSILQGSEKFCPECGAPNSESKKSETVQESNIHSPPSVQLQPEKAPPDPALIFCDESDEDDCKNEPYEHKKSRFPIFLALICKTPS